MRAYTAQKLRSENRTAAFRLLLQNKSLSKIDLSNRLGISPPTAGKIINYFLAEGLALSVGPASPEQGRPAEMVAPNYQSLLYIGAVVEGESMKIGLFNLQGKLLESVKQRVQDIGLCEVIEHEMPRMIGRLNRDNGRIAAVGLGVPGIYDQDTNIIHAAPLIHIHRPLSIKNALLSLESRVGCRVYADNDVNLAATGEMHNLGGARSDLLYVTLGTGLGAAIINNGSLVRGSRGRAGEIGYTTFEKTAVSSGDSPGWLESRINSEALIQRYNLQQIEQLADLSAEVREEAAHYIANSLVPCILNLGLALDTQRIIIGGEIPELLGACFYRVIRQRIEMPGIFHAEITPPGSDHCDILGAFRMAMELSLESLFQYESEG